MRRAPLLGLLVATSAHAAPIAAALEDVDGDGRKDALALEANGELSIANALAVKLPPQAKARIEVGTWKQKPIVLVVGEKEAFVVEPTSPKGWKLSGKTAVGGVGLDADYELDVTATSSGIIRFQRRQGIRRCDGKPALVFAEGFDGTKFRRLSALPIDVDPNAPKLAAKPDPAAPLPVLYNARFASHQIGAGDAGGLGIPTELDDGKAQTMWREELSSDGEGQFFTFETRAQGLLAKHVRIAGAGKAFNRPKRIAIVGATAAFHAELPDDTTGAAFAVELPQAIAGCITVILEETYGPEKGQTAISELSVYADGERAGGAEPMLAAIIAAGGETKNAEAVLAKRGAVGANALEAEILKTKDARVRRRLLGVIAKIDDAAAVPMLVRAATEGWVEEEGALVDIVRALGRRGMNEELAQLAGKSSFLLAARIAAAEAIKPSDAKTFALLVDLAGTGPNELRKVVIERLALAAVADLIAAAAKETEASSAGDLWRAVTKRAKSVPADRAVALAAMQVALPVADDYDRRYRLIDGIATLGDAAAIRALEATLKALPAGAIGAALRHVAVVGAASAPRAEALSLVVGLAKDPDPGVRLAVLAALADVEVDNGSAWHTPDPDGIDRIITAALATDTWPDVRRRAASSLGVRCQRPGPRLALVEAIAKDASVEVRGDSLVALVQCRAQGVTEILAKVWDDTRAPMELRTRAVSLAAVLGDAKLGATLVGKFAKWRGEAIGAGDDGEAALGLAVSAAPVIAILDAPGAVQALTEALYDEAFPEIVSAAATGLGKLGAKCPASAKAKLVEISKSGSDAARAAEIAVSGCGGKAR